MKSTTKSLIVLKDAEGKPFYKSRVNEILTVFRGDKQIGQIVRIGKNYIYSAPKFHITSVSFTKLKDLIRKTCY